jgi:hypothetical protein
MARFEIAVLANELLKPATREQMWTPQMAADGSENGYALGWGHSKKFGLSLVSHSGSQQAPAHRFSWCRSGALEPLCSPTWTTSTPRLCPRKF